MEILIALLIATAIAHGGTQRGRAAARDGFQSFRNASRALRGRGGPGAKERLLNDYRDGRAFLGDRKQSVSKGRPDAAVVSNGKIVAAAAWRGYKGGWTGETARQHAEASDQHNNFPSTEEKGTTMEHQPFTQREMDGLRAAAAEADMNGPDAQEKWERRARENGVITYPARERDTSVATPPPAATEIRRGHDHAHATPLSRGATMPIATATGGEVLNYPQLLAELDSIVAEAAAELEDRQAAKQRAQDDVRRIDVMLASLGQLELDPESMSKLQGIAETNGSKMQLATQAAANAEHRHALAVDAKTTVVRKHQMLQEAHMAAGRDAAHKQFYQGG